MDCDSDSRAPPYVDTKPFPRGARNTLVGLLLRSYFTLTCTPPQRENSGKPTRRFGLGVSPRKFSLPYLCSFTPLFHFHLPSLLRGRTTRVGDVHGGRDHSVGPSMWETSTFPVLRAPKCRRTTKTRSGERDFYCLSLTTVHGTSHGVPMF